MGTGTERPRVLFVCIENACRSQMAEAFARAAGEGRVEAFSAGSRPAGRVDPTAVALMAEEGHDLSGQRSKSLQEVPQGRYRAVVSMGCGDACPWMPAERRIEWDIPDPKGLPPDRFREVRDRIRAEVEALLREL